MGKLQDFKVIVHMESDKSMCIWRIYAETAADAVRKVLESEHVREGIDYVFEGTESDVPDITVLKEVGHNIWHISDEFVDAMTIYVLQIDRRDMY